MDHSRDRRLIGRPDLVPQSCRSEHRRSASDASPSASRTRARASDAPATSACSRSGRPPAPARRRRHGLGRDRPPRSRSPPARRAAVPAAGRYPVAAPWREPARDAPARRVSRPPPLRTRLAPTHQRQPRLRLPAGTMRGQEGLLGPSSRPCAAGSAELAERPSHLTAEVRPQLLAGHQRLALRVVACAAQPQDLRAVHAAAAMEAFDGVGAAPPLHRLRPLLRDVVLRQSLQGAHELAVHDPGGERIEIAGDRRHADVVEQRESVRDIAVQDAQSRSRHPTDGAGRGVVLRAHRDRTLGPLPGFLDVADQHPLVRPDDRQPSVRGCVLMTLEQLFCPGEPAAHRRHQRGVQEQVHRDTDRCARRRDRIAGLDAESVRALPRLDGHVEMARRVRDLREQRQLGRTQEPVRVGLHEQLVGRLPISLRRRFPGVLKAHRTLP